MEYVLQTRSLSKKYKRDMAVNKVSINIKRGEIYGFIGRNGAGKTTCMKMICGLISPTDGEVSLFGGSSLQRTNNYGRVGSLIENPGLYGNLSAYDNIKLKVIALGIHKDSYIESLLSLVGLNNTGNKKVKKFSLGMKQRLGIAMALVGEPDILILDEPINGLDPQGIAEIRETLVKLKTEKNITIMISSHILEELSKIVDTYGIIHKGELLEEISKGDLANKCQDYIEIKSSTCNKICVVLDQLNIKAYKVVDNETIYIYEGIDNTSKINKSLALEECDVKSLRVVAENLEDYYIQLTGGVIND